VTVTPRKASPLKARSAEQDVPDAFHPNIIGQNAGAVQIESVSPPRSNRPRDLELDKYSVTVKPFFVKKGQKLASTGLAAVYELEVKRDSRRLHDKPLIKTYAECCQLHDALFKQYLPAPFSSTGMLVGGSFGSAEQRADRMEATGRELGRKVSSGNRGRPGHIEGEDQGKKFLPDIVYELLATILIQCITTALLSFLHLPSGTSSHYLLDEKLNLSMLTAFLSKIIGTEPFVSDDLVRRFFEPANVVPASRGGDRQSTGESEAGRLQEELRDVHGKLQAQISKISELEMSAKSEKAALRQQNEALSHEVNLLRRALDEDRKKTRHVPNTRAHTHAHAHKYTHPHADTQAHTNTHTHTSARARAHTHTQAQDGRTLAGTPARIQQFLLKPGARLEQAVPALPCSSLAHALQGHHMLLHSRAARPSLSGRLFTELARF